MSNEIQKARDVLAGWREQAVAGPWEARQDTPTMGGSAWSLRVKGTPGIRASVSEYQHGDGLACLIVGTAGNPKLWDALDGMLKAAAESIPGDRYTPYPVEFVQHAERIADAIIAADERMGS